MSELIYQTKSIYTIRKICMLPDIKKHLISEEIDDFAMMSLKRLMDKKLIIYAIKWLGKLVGIAFFEEKKEGEVRVDTAFVSEIRGKTAKMLAEKTLNEYIGTNKPKIIRGEIVKKNKRSLIFGQWLGFKIKDQDEYKYYVEKEISWAA